MNALTFVTASTIVAILASLAHAQTADALEASRLPLPSQWSDLSFERFLDVRLLPLAVNSVDPALITDLGLQLAEGERVLGRSHDAISSHEVLDLAVRAAVERQDEDTLARLERVARTQGREELLDAVSTARKSTGHSRGIAAVGLVDVTRMPPESLLAYRTYLDRIRVARVLKDEEGMRQLQSQLDSEARFPVEQRSLLRSVVRDSLALDPQPSVLSKSLSRLLGASRGGFCSICGAYYGVGGAGCPHVRGGGTSGGGTSGGGTSGGGTSGGGTSGGGGEGTPDTANGTSNVEEYRRGDSPAEVAARRERNRDSQRQDERVPTSIRRSPNEQKQDVTIQPSFDSPREQYEWGKKTYEDLVRSYPLAKYLLSYQDIIEGATIEDAKLAHEIVVVARHVEGLIRDHEVLLMWADKFKKLEDIEERADRVGGAGRARALRQALIAAANKAFGKIAFENVHHGGASGYFRAKADIVAGKIRNDSSYRDSRYDLFEHRRLVRQQRGSGGSE